MVAVQGRVLAIVPAADIPKHHPQTRLPEGAFIAPGFIDLQVNGGGGLLLNDSPSADAMRAIARVHRRFGTTACLPTFITDSREKTRDVIAAAQAAAGRDGVIGIHLEGPFINPARAGVHRRECIAQADLADIHWLAGLSKVGRSLITLAPECVPPGFIRGLVNRSIRAAAGHSEASAEEMAGAIAEGLTGVTHLFNAMPPLTSRAPGVAGTALADPRLIPGIIVDGFHVHPTSVRAAFAAKTGCISLVTDAMPSVGAKETRFDLLGRPIILDGRRLIDDAGRLAGAHLDMASAVRNTVNLTGTPLEDALVAASRTPARFLGLDPEYGALTKSSRADMVALTHEMDVLETWIAGVEQSPGW